MSHHSALSDNVICGKCYTQSLKNWCTIITSIWFSFVLCENLSQGYSFEKLNLDICQQRSTENQDTELSLKSQRWIFASTLGWLKRVSTNQSRLSSSVGPFFKWSHRREQEWMKMFE